jgi:hypothetical protein
VQIISPEGEYIDTISCWTDDPEPLFHSPTGVAIDSNGLLYMADKDDHRVQILDISTPMTPTLVATIGEAGICGADNDHLCYPSSVALDVEGNIISQT